MANLVVIKYSRSYYTTENQSTWSRKFIFDLKIFLDEGSKINFEVVKMDILRPNYGHSKFTKSVDTHMNHKCLTTSTENLLIYEVTLFLKSYHI